MFPSKALFTRDELNQPGQHFTMYVIVSKDPYLVSAYVLDKKPTPNEWVRAHWFKKLRRDDVRLYIIGKGEEPTEAFLTRLASAWLDKESPFAAVDLKAGTINRYAAPDDEELDEHGIPTWIKELAYGIGSEG